MNKILENKEGEEGEWGWRCGERVIKRRRFQKRVDGQVRGR
jgi:hypothetical protein